MYARYTWSHSRPGAIKESDTPHMSQRSHAPALHRHRHPPRLCRRYHSACTRHWNQLRFHVPVRPNTVPWLVTPPTGDAGSSLAYPTPSMRPRTLLRSTSTRTPGPRFLIERVPLSREYVRCSYAGMRSIHRSYIRVGGLIFILEHGVPTSGLEIIFFQRIWKQVVRSVSMFPIRYRVFHDRLICVHLSHEIFYSCFARYRDYHCTVVPAILSFTSQPSAG